MEISPLSISSLPASTYSAMSTTRRTKPNDIFTFSLILTTALMLWSHRFRCINLPKIRSNTPLLKAMKGFIGKLSLRDQFGTLIIEDGKYVCGSLISLSNLSVFALDKWTYFGINSQCPRVGVVDSVTNLMVARILLTGRALNKILTISSRRES